MDSLQNTKARTRTYYLIKHDNTAPVKRHPINIFDCVPKNQELVNSRSSYIQPLRFEESPKKAEFQRKEINHKRVKTEETFKEQGSRMDIFMTTVKEMRKTGQFSNMAISKTEPQERSARLNNRIVGQIDRFVSKKGILSEVYYRQDLIKKKGDKYFEYTLRNRAEEQGQTPYLYCFREGQEVGRCAEAIKNLHPQIPVRKFMKIRGKKVLRSTPKTETAP